MKAKVDPSERVRKAGSLANWTEAIGCESLIEKTELFADLLFVMKAFEVIFGLERALCW